MKITCDVIQDLMPSYIDGILSEDSKALVEEHMGTCQAVSYTHLTLPTNSRV